MSVRVDRNGRLFVKLVPNHLIAVFDSLGEMIKVVGEKGFGPGELTKILDFRAINDGQLYVMDAITEEVSLFDLRRGWLSTFPAPAKHNMTFDILQNRILFFRRAFEDNNNSHIVVTPIGFVGQLKDSAEMFLRPGDESIRTHMLMSQALCTNADGVTVFAFMAASVIYVLSAHGELSEIEIDRSTYKISETKDLMQKYHNDKSKGLIGEVFRNSRVLSVGFISAEHILVSFATGRFEHATFYAQVYCLATGECCSKAYKTEGPLFYVGYHTFAAWAKSVEGVESKPGKENSLILYRFRSIH
jgi:hypothetical protein